MFNWKFIVNPKEFLRLEVNKPTIFLPKLKFLKGFELNHIALRILVSNQGK